MSIFNPVPIGWEGQDYVIAAERVMGAIAVIENVVTLHELQRFAARGTAPMATLAMAYGAVLRYAGARVTDEQVYAGMLGPGAKAPDIGAAIAGLLQMMIPPNLAPAGGGAVAPGNGGGRPSRKVRRRDAARSSKKPTSSSSAARSG